MTTKSIKLSVPSKLVRMYLQRDLSLFYEEYCLLWPVLPFYRHEKSKRAKFEKVFVLIMNAFGYVKCPGEMSGRLIRGGIPVLFIMNLTLDKFERRSEAGLGPTMKICDD